MGSPFQGLFGEVVSGEKAMTESFAEAAMI
jgi:hypothetical protein